MKALLQQALDALTLARSQLDRLWVSHHANRTDLAMMHAQESIEALRAAIAAAEPEPVAYVVALAGRPISMTVPVFKLDDLAKMHNAPLYLTPPDTEALRKELDRVKGEREAMKLDADRYRYIRDTDNGEVGSLFIGVDSSQYPSRWALSEGEADKAIDAAMAAQGDERWAT